MKKALTVLIAVLLIAVSAMPAFAESVNSPTPTKGNYNVNISVGEDIGTVTYDFVSGVDGMFDFVRNQGKQLLQLCIMLRRDRKPSYLREIIRSSLLRNLNQSAI